jgi:hypothetical protein
LHSPVVFVEHGLYPCQMWGASAAACLGCSAPDWLVAKITLLSRVPLCFRGLVILSFEFWSKGNASLGSWPVSDAVSRPQQGSAGQCVVSIDKVLGFW